MMRRSIVDPMIGLRAGKRTVDTEEPMTDALKKHAWIWLVGAFAILVVIGVATS